MKAKGSELNDKLKNNESSNWVDASIYFRIRDRGFYGISGAISKAAYRCIRCYLSWRFIFVFTDWNIHDPI